MHLFFSAANFIFYCIIQATIFIVKFIKKIAKLLFLKLKSKFNLKSIVRSSRFSVYCWSPRFSVLRGGLLNSETTNKNLTKLKDCASSFCLGTPNPSSGVQKNNFFSLSKLKDCAMYFLFILLVAGAFATSNATAFSHEKNEYHNNFYSLNTEIISQKNLIQFQKICF